MSGTKTVKKGTFRSGVTLYDLEIPQTEGFQCDVLIWRSMGFAKALVHPGHAAVLLRRAVDKGPWHLTITTAEHMVTVGGQPKRQKYVQRREVTPNINLNSMRYISFWPGAEKGFHKVQGHFSSNHLRDFAAELSESASNRLENEAAAPRPGQVVIGSDAYWGDFWGKRPDIVISIPGLSGIRPTKLGLNFNRMVEWAASKSDQELEWKFITNSRNCAGVAVGSLKAGGGEAFAAVGGDYRKMTLYTNPNDAQHWSEAVSRGVQYVNRMLEMLHNATAKLPPQGGDLMSYRGWRSISGVAWTIRGPETTAIDKALQQYHAANWQDQYPAKLKALVQIIESISDHMLKRTKRDGAYLELARQVMGVVAALSRSGDRPWTSEDFYSKDDDFAISDGTDSSYLGTEDSSSDHDDNPSIHSYRPPS